MDLDINNILYIVITLVAVIVGLLGKKKKPGQGGADSSGSSASPGFLENLERVLNMGQEEPVIADTEPYEEDLRYEEAPEEMVKSPAAATKRPGIMDDYNRLMNRGTDGEMSLVNSEGQQMTESVEIIDLDYVPGVDYFDLIEEFDAGKAIVYSSIINRLDY